MKNKNKKITTFGQVVRLPAIPYVRVFRDKKDRESNPKYRQNYDD